MARVVDLFCGGGGFSEGARAAGCDVVLAVDCDAEALQVHASNHPSTTHVCARLPDDALHARLLDHVREGAHVHASPPCQKLSQANRRATSDDVDASLSLVRWYLDFVVAARPRTWTMEQVGVPAVRDVLRRARDAHPEVVDFLVVDVSDFGVPQNRRRVLAGPPALVERLRKRTASAPASVRDLVPDAPATHVQSTTTNTPVRGEADRTHRPLRPEEHVRAVDGPSYTILARQAPWWCDARGTRLRRLTPQECALVQTFPPEYNLSRVRTTAAQRIVGNAVPPRLAADVMRTVAQLRGDA